MRFISFLLFFAILGRPVLPVLDYVFNYDYIASELCINREMPELNCNGKCYLMQAMAKEAKKERQDKKGNLILRYEPALLYFEDTSLTWDPAPLPETTVGVNHFYNNLYRFFYQKNHLRPPIV